MNGYVECLKCNSNDPGMTLSDGGCNCGLGHWQNWDANTCDDCYPGCLECHGSGKY